MTPDQLENADFTCARENCGESVKDDGDYCAECAADIAEHDAEAAKDREHDERCALGAI